MKMEFLPSLDSTCRNGPRTAPICKGVKRLSYVPPAGSGRLVASSGRTAAAVAASRLPLLLPGAIFQMSLWGLFFPLQAALVWMPLFSLLKRAALGCVALAP